MRAIKLTGTVEPDHTLHLHLPEDAVVGPAEVIVLLPEGGRAESGSLDGFLDNLQEPEHPLSAEEIDRYLASERASWE
jgi:hypothetical protein